MLLWFAGAGLVAVWAVFRSPALDYRLVMLGAVLPVGEVVLGGPRVLHTLLAGVVVLFAVVLATQRRRLLRRRLIGLPIGMLVHLVLDGVWTRTSVFWWPFFGTGFGAGALPELDRPLPIIVAADLVGAGCLVWAWRRFGVGDPQRRSRFLRSGRLEPQVTT
jgi:hypothetical protein